MDQRDIGNDTMTYQSQDMQSELPCFPILTCIDRARGDLFPPFAADQNAPLLEQRARVLTARHWSDLTWLTGRVPALAFRFVCEELERERRTLANDRANIIGSAA
jgi:hypothetical protein